MRLWRVRQAFREGLDKLLMLHLEAVEKYGMVAEYGLRIPSTYNYGHLTPVEGVVRAITKNGSARFVWWPEKVVLEDRTMLRSVPLFGRDPVSGEQRAVGVSFPIERSHGPVNEHFNRSLKYISENEVSVFRRNSRNELQMVETIVPPWSELGLAPIVVEMHGPEIKPLYGKMMAAISTGPMAGMVIELLPEQAVLNLLANPHFQLAIDKNAGPLLIGTCHFNEGPAGEEASKEFAQLYYKHATGSAADRDIYFPRSGIVPGKFYLGDNSGIILLPGTPQGWLAIRNRDAFLRFSPPGVSV